MEALDVFLILYSDQSIQLRKLLYRSGEQSESPPSTHHGSKLSPWLFDAKRILRQSWEIWTLEALQPQRCATMRRPMPDRRAASDAPYVPQNPWLHLYVETGHPWCTNRSFRPLECWLCGHPIGSCVLSVRDQCMDFTSEPLFKMRLCTLCLGVWGIT